jgi:hypothetical protein
MLTTSKSATAPPKPAASATSNVPLPATPDRCDREPQRARIESHNGHVWPTLGGAFRAFVAQPCSPRGEQQREYPIEAIAAAVSTQQVPHAALDRRVLGCLDGPDGATGSTRHVW